jgi:uncharacterized damage-inducible protein DinB
LDQIRQIGEKIDSARNKLLAAVEGLDDDAWDWQPGDGRWSARLTLAHVGSAHWSHLEVARSLVAGEMLDLPGFELDSWNQARVAERAAWSPGKILADLKAAQDATLAFMAELEAKDLETRGVHPALGEVSAGQVLRVIALHDSLHRRDILKLLREMSA